MNFLEALPVKDILEIKVKGWSCNRFRSFFGKGMDFAYRKMSNYNLLCYSRIGSMMEEKEMSIMTKKIKCPGFLCGSTDVEYLGGNQRTSLNLNPLHPFTLVNTKPKGKQKFRCRKCGKVFEAKIR